MERPGKLIVRPRSAKLFRDTSIISMDPYVVVKCGSQEQKTSYCKDGGKSPTWSEELIFTVTSENAIYIAVWDKIPSAIDKEIGSAILPFESITSASQEGITIDIFHKGLVAGHVIIGFLFYPESISGLYFGNKSKNLTEDNKYKALSEL